MTQPIPPRTVRVRVFDGTYEVLRKRQIIREMDTTPAALNAVLPSLLVQLAREANVMENEPMSHPRIELWTTDGELICDYSGGWL
jgi:hypothetical protein